MNIYYTILKIFSSIIVLLIPISLLIRDWKYKDARTKRHHQITRIIISFGLIGGIITCLIIWQDESVSGDNTKKLQELKELNNKLLSQNQFLQKSIDSMNSSNKNLRNSNNLLYSQNESLINQSISLISKIDKYQTEIEIQKKQIDILKNYSKISSYNAFGNPYEIAPNSDIKINSELTNLIEKTYTINNGKALFKRDSDSEKIYRTIIEKYPLFPFGYYFLVLVLRDKNDSSWRFYANKAVDILKNTTMIQGHNPNHDEVLNKLQNYLKEE